MKSMGKCYNKSQNAFFFIVLLAFYTLNDLLYKRHYMVKHFLDLRDECLTN